MDLVWDLLWDASQFLLEFCFEDSSAGASFSCESMEDVM